MVQHVIRRFLQLTREQRYQLRHHALHGVDIVQSVIRLCAMNLLLHNMTPSAAQEDAPLPVHTNDPLRQLGPERSATRATNSGPPLPTSSSTSCSTSSHCSRSTAAGTAALEELLAGDKINLNLFWLKDDSLLNSESLSDPDLIAAEIANGLRSALKQIKGILADIDPIAP